MLNFTGPYPEPYLIVSSRKEIGIVHLTSVYKKTITDGRIAISNFFIDPFRQLLYFHDGMSIYQSNLDGSNTSLVNGNFDIWTFAFDYMGKRLFWVHSTSKRTIIVGSLDFQNSRQFVIHKKDILSLAVDPSYG